METKKRERSANFNKAEVQLLLSLVERYKEIIENKKTDAVTNKDKESAWKKIEISFNSSGISADKRSWKTLKLKYEGVKKATKKKSSVQRQEMYRTGGGPSNAPDFSDVEEKVMSICSNIKGLEARHDSDTIQSVPTSISDMVVMDVEKLKAPDTEQPKNAEDIVQDININIPDMNESFTVEINDNQSQKENRWDKWHPKALKSRVSNALKHSDAATKASVTSKLDQLSAARLELVQIQMETATKERQFKEDEHKLKMETARKEQQFKEDEHKLKMEHLANDEKRKQEIHILLLEKLNCAHLLNDTINKNL